MSGGHYDYKYSSLEILADEIERDFIHDGDYINEWSDEHETLNHLDDRDLSEAQQKELLKKVKDLTKRLRDLSKDVKNLEWMMSGDISPKTLYELYFNEK